MSSGENEAGADEVPPPHFLLPGLRTALEMALVGLIVALIGLPVSDPMSRGLVLLTGLVAMVIVLFWAINRQMAEWIRRAQGRPTLRDQGGWL